MNTLVITGLLRNIPEFFSALNHAMDLRQLGYVDQVILSTWHGEIDSEISELLIKAEVSTIESCPPPGNIFPKPFWNTSAQTVSLLRALEYIEDSDSVLKIRTDKSTSLIDRYIPYLKRGLSDTEGTHFFSQPPLQKKLIVRLVRASVPFHINDFTVMGLCSDLKKVCRSQFGLEHRAPANALGAENRWLLGPFFDHSIYLRSFFESFRGFDLMEALNSWASKKSEALPSAIQNLFSLYFSYLYACFENLDEPDELEEQKPAQEVRSYFNIEDFEFAESIGTSKGIVRNIKSVNGIKEFVRSKEIFDPTLNNNPLSENQFNEISEFIKTYSPRSSKDVNKISKIRLFPTTSGPHSSILIDLKQKIIESLIECGLDSSLTFKITPILDRKEILISPLKAFAHAANALIDEPDVPTHTIAKLLTKGAKLREPFAQRLLVDLNAKDKSIDFDRDILAQAKKDIERQNASPKRTPK